MIFATPLAAAGFATAAGLAAVYCFRRKSPEKTVGSLLLWPRLKTVSTQSRRRDRLVKGAYRGIRNDLRLRGAEG